MHERESLLFSSPFFPRSIGRRRPQRSTNPFFLTPPPNDPIDQPNPNNNNKQPSADAFTDLVARCPLLNVRARTAGQTVDTDHFSCLGVFADPEAFRAYANGTAGAPKGSYAEKSGAGAGGRMGGRGLVVAAGAAAGAMLLLG